MGPVPTPRAPSLPAQLTDAAPSVLTHDDSFAEAAIGGCELPGQVARGVSLRECTLTGTDLSSSKLEGFGLSDVALRGCNLANLAAPRASLMRTTFDECRMTGMAVSGGLLRDVVIRGCRVDLASFGGCRLQRVSFEDCRLTQTDFLEAELDGVRFTGCDLTEADLRGARLRRCELRGNTLDGLLGIESLRGAAMRWADIVEGAPLWASALGITALED